MITTCFFIAMMVISFFVIFPIYLIVWLFTFWFDKRRVIVHRFTCIWASLLTILMLGWRIKVIDRKNLNSKGAKVIVCNHQSLLDVPILYRLRKNFKFISKAGVFKVPFLGWVMYLNKYIGVERGTIKSMVKMMQDCADNLKQGSSILIFPEGTRSEDGKLKPFKTGAFSLAKDNQKSIVPVVIKGATGLLTKKTLKMKPFKKITVKVLEEIPYDAIKDKSLADIANSIQELMSAELEKL